MIQAIDFSLKMESGASKNSKDSSTIINTSQIKAAKQPDSTTSALEEFKGQTSKKFKSNLINIIITGITYPAPSGIEEKISTSPALLAWSSSHDNISVVELKDKQNYANFKGAQLRCPGFSNNFFMQI